MASYTPGSVTASGLLKTGAGVLKGIMIAAASATPTIKLWDNTSGATTVLVNTFTPTAGQNLLFGDGIPFTKGLYITISGTVDCTPYFD